MITEHDVLLKIEKVTAVQLTRVTQASEWQKEYGAFTQQQEEFLAQARSAKENA